MRIIQRFMANWNEIQQDIIKKGSTFDIIRREFLRKLFEFSGRNIILYYSGWLQKNLPEISREVALNDMDKNGFMTAINGLDPSRGLDLILHTPGGEVAATESIIDYLKSKFSDIRAIIPQLSMSGGTMIACSSNRIVMGRHSSLGPVDPQIGGIPAHGVVEEFERAHAEIKADQSRLAVWQFVLSKYSPTFLGECIKAVEWSEKILVESLKDRMFKDSKYKESMAEKVKTELCDHSISLSHSRHLSSRKCKEIGLVVEELENDPVLQDLVLSLHHVTMQTLAMTPAFKIIENQNGQAFIQSVTFEKR